LHRNIWSGARNSAMNLGDWANFSVRVSYRLLGRWNLHNRRGSS